MVLLEEVIIIRVSNPNSGFMEQLEQIIKKYECENWAVASKRKCIAYIRFGSRKPYG